MPNTQRGSDQFATLVRQILVVEKRRSICDVAAALGMEYANFHARVCGRVHFKAHEINQLIRAVPDVRLCEFLLRDTLYLPVVRPQPTETTNESALHATTHLAGLCLGIIEAISDAAMERHLEPAAYDQLVTQVHEAEHAVANLLAALPGLAPRQSRLGGARSSAEQIGCIHHRSANVAAHANGRRQRHD